MKNNECVNVTLVCDDMKAIQINLSVELKKKHIHKWNLLWKLEIFYDRVKANEITNIT